ncbi:MAG: hypothetical protein OEO21_07300 [Candidatus Krumholzibacteria bacterium]|nr:hypothetical protein [Candidatus Krumholzibacteria bacterium]
MKRLQHILRRLRRATRGRVLATGRALRTRRSVAGFTLIEIAFACEVMMLLSLVAFSETRRLENHAKIAACMRYQGSIQRNLWAMFAFDGAFPPDIAPVLATMAVGAIPQTYDYALVGPGADQYYLRCGHDHSYVAVLFVDSGAYLPPKAIYVLAAARGTI